MPKNNTDRSELFLPYPPNIYLLFGINDSFVHLIEESLDIQIDIVSNQLRILGAKDNINKARNIILQLEKMIEADIEITMTDVKRILDEENQSNSNSDNNFFQDVIYHTKKGQAIRPKNKTQREFVKAVEKNSITFAVGPAGTGKTFLAAVLAVAHLRSHKVDRIILTRPAVEAGESLGFLPGDLKEKVDPYLRPVYDVLDEIMGPDQSAKLVERGIIEIAPLAYMRGRTLNNAFVILDEAQNTTSMQMKMFLTRLGVNSKMIVNGDISQIDLPPRTMSGLKQATKILSDVEGIGFIEFDSHDVVRHHVVSAIIEAYKKAGE